MVFSRIRFFNKVLFFAVGILLFESQDISADATFSFDGIAGDVTANNYASSFDASAPLTLGDDLTVGGLTKLGDVEIGGALKQVTDGVFSVYGNKKLATSITEAPSNVLTVNFSTLTGSSLVHIIVFGDIAGGDIKYDAWIYLGTGNSMIQSARRNVSAGAMPTINVTFSEGAGTATIMISTGADQSVTNPVVFYEVCGAKIKNVE